MSNNVKSVMMIGCGTMGKEYYKVLKDLDVEIDVIGRGQNSAQRFEEETGLPVYTKGLQSALEKRMPEYAIVCVDGTQLYNVTSQLIQQGVKNILVEKPAGMNLHEIEQLSVLATQNNSNVYVGYNRRFYASTEKALEIIQEDGGVSSFNFEFTEWWYKIVDAGFSAEVMDRLFFGNSTHVCDLAFFLGGFPKEIKCFVEGKLEGHPSAKAYAGAGVSEKGALFSYQANWDAPGRWSVEVLTSKHRLYFKPMEELQIQEKGSVAVNHVEIDNTLDLKYKPGLYKQVVSFLENIDDGKKLTIQEQFEHYKIYEMMECSIES